MFDKMPILYIIMRTDLESMNPGKAIAQGSHAANQAVKLVKSSTTGSILIEEWENQTLNANPLGYDTGENLGFGTVLTLAGGTMEEIEDLISEIDVKDSASFTGFLFDPTYPIRDGKVCHHIPLHTCAWVFTRQGSAAQKLLSKLELHP